MINKIRTNIKFSFIGCGLIGNKRANFLDVNSIIGCYDSDKSKAKIFSKKYSCIFYKDFKNMIRDSDAIIISTPHRYLAKFAIQSMKYNKHVFIEKPGAVSLSSLKKLTHYLTKTKKKIKVQVGYNHRFHPSIIKARKMVDNHDIGEIMYIRSRYGHGARKNYHKEWRMNKFISGGGELIDQGSHLIDLARVFLGEFVKVQSNLRSFFWKSKVEDNVFLTMFTKNKKIAFLHASCTEWKNKFSFEIFGRKGKLEINGLGGSYGEEKLYFYKMSKNFGKPKLKVYRFVQKIDLSWKRELSDFVNSIKLNKKVTCDLNEAYKNMSIIDKCYNKESKL